MLLLQDYTHTIPNFGLRSLSLEDLSSLCDRYGIYVLFEHMDILHGCSFFENGQPYIVINSVINISEQTIAGYHEFVHLDRHIYLTPCRFTTCAFKSTGNLINLSKMEYEAQSVGLYALMPDRLIKDMNPFDIMVAFDVNLDTALFRLSLTSLYRV
jgi:Zn-dependent peptidase ImmA (M78 family)